MDLTPDEAAEAVERYDCPADLAKLKPLYLVARVLPTPRVSRPASVRMCRCRSRDWATVDERE